MRTIASILIWAKNEDYLDVTLVELERQAYPKGQARIYMNLAHRG